MRYYPILVGRYEACTDEQSGNGSHSPLVAIIGFAIGYVSCDYTWFSRSGSLLVGIGIIVLSRTFISGIELHQSVLGAGTGKDVYTSEHHLELGNDVPDYVIEQDRNKLALGRLGPGISCVGTVIWGFGDLVGRIQC